jgi:hypothetical protein
LKVRNVAINLEIDVENGNVSAALSNLLDSLDSPNMRYMNVTISAEIDKV